ncbi:MAG: hypothetical protein AB7O24_28470 [Kofleriaceae bacterium]
MFKWACFGLAVVTIGVFGWMVNDVRTELKHTNHHVNENLPEILANAKQVTGTLAQLSKDVEGLRDLAGIASGPQDRSLVVYADSVLDFLEQQTGQVGLEKVIGGGIKDAVSVQDWVQSARKEAVWLSFRASTKAELLDRLAKNKFGSAWQFVSATGERIPLIDLVRKNHPGSAAQ